LPKRRVDLIQSVAKKICDDQYAFPFKDQLCEIGALARIDQQVLEVNHLSVQLDAMRSRCRR
jgi:hypothetical protein